MLNIFRVSLYISILFNSIVLSASVYDNDVLNIFSKVLPRLVLMSSQKEKIKDEIGICILHDSVDERAARLLINKTDANYPNGIKNYKIKIIKTTYSNINKCKNTKLIFLLNSDKKNIKDALDFSTKYTILTSSYSYKLLEFGVGISMYLGRKTTPYINMNSIYKKEIKINNNLLRISKIYNREAK